MSKANRIILFSALIFTCVKIYDLVDYKINEYAVENMIKNNNSYLKTDYEGYVEIASLNIRRKIVKGISDYNLLHNVCINSFSNLENGNVVLAGHAIKNIFGNLKCIKYGDVIDIYYHNKKYSYVVYEMLQVNKENTKVLDNDDLILITCVNNSKRLIVKAKKI